MGNMGYLRWPLRIAGAGLLIATAAIHLDLYLTGYRTISVIGPLFLFQVIVTFALALAVLVTPLLAGSSRHAARAGWAAWADAASAAAGALFAVATLGGYLLTVWVGLFGFREVRTTAGVVAGILEIAAFAALALLTFISLPTPTPVTSGRARALRAVSEPHSAVVPVIAGLTVVAALVFGISVGTASGGASGGPATASAHAALRTTSINGVTVLTNSSGRTLYWFQPDTSSRSACYGTCASYWPPVYGTPSVASGVTG